MIPDRPSSSSPRRFLLRCLLHLLLGATLAGVVAVLCLLGAVRAGSRETGRFTFLLCMFAAGVLLCLVEAIRPRTQNRAACILSALGGFALAAVSIYLQFFT